MNRRRRALLFGLGAVGAAMFAVILVNGYSSSVAGTYGELTPVVVLTRDLEEGRPISPREAANSLEVRQVPRLFAPTASLRSPDLAVGLEPVSLLPAGSYLSANLIRPPEVKKKTTPAVGAGRHPVELSVSGTGALSESSGPGTRVDVLVSRENRNGAGGHTYLAASHVPLLAVGSTTEGEIGTDLAKVTLALTSREALELVEAQTFARRVTVLPVGGR